MNERIAIIDPDLILSRSMSRRIMHLIPDSRVSLYTPEAVRSDESLCLSEGIIFYDEKGADPDLLLRHAAGPAHPHLIPLQASGTDERRRLTGTELTRMIREASICSGYGTETGNTAGSRFATDAEYATGCAGNSRCLREKPDPGLPLSPTDQRRPGIRPWCICCPFRHLASGCGKPAAISALR